MIASLTIGKWEIEGASFKVATRSDATFKIKLAPELPHDADLTINIPDFGLPTVEDTRSMVAAMERHEHVFMGCMGGIGRTGTMIGCVLQSYRARRRKTIGYKFNKLFRRTHKTDPEFHPADPVKWVRKNFKGHAIETDEQEAFVRDFK